MFKKSKKIDYQNNITGTWGDFNVGTSKVSYLQTKAKIGKPTPDSEKRLTGFLHPVREVLGTSSMDFNQLLQRDLDDHRVAEKLVRYILQPENGRPVYFPPIVAALLPFEQNEVRERFPQRSELELTEDSSGIHWSGYFFDNAFKFEKVVDPDTGTDFDIKIGKLSWNQEGAKLVVIDGQHRAMALIAIDRTLNETWTGAGEKYKSFYEPIIKDLASKLTQSEKDDLIKNLEFPVNIIWFPEDNNDKYKPHEIARRLFVDINSNARTPSESRILLLSDGDLLSIFTRKLLNQFRSNNDGLPIYAIEYDHPGRDQTSSSKWSVISNVMTLRDAVLRSVFGPKKYIDDVTSKIGGKEGEIAKGEFMRQTLRISDEIPISLTHMNRDDITDSNFPKEYLPFLQERFIETWGKLIYKVLSQVQPYKSHGEALKILKNNWLTADSIGRLANDAIFEGVGMYWTIRDAYLHWQGENAQLAEANQPQKHKTDIVKTWLVLEEKNKEFSKIRTEIFLGKSTSNNIELSDAAYSAYETNACQVGLILAIRSIAHQAFLKIEDLDSLFSQIISAINTALTKGPDPAFGRKLLFSKKQAHPKTPIFNLIPKLDSPLSVYFRYFWLELLSSNESHTLIGNEKWFPIIQELRDHSRLHYLKYITSVNAKAIKSQDPLLPQSEINKKAQETSEKLIFKALNYWFKIDESTWKTWLSKPQAEDAGEELPQGLEESDIVSLKIEGDLSSEGN